VHRTRSRTTVDLARAHGLCNVLGGAWPLLHMRSFEAVLGPKTDRWLVRTVAGLLVANGVVQLRATGPAEVHQAARIGIGTAAVLLLADLRYAVPGRISRMYLLDAVAEAGWIAAWLRSDRHRLHH
jgi:hypothetical protein